MKTLSRALLTLLAACCLLLAACGDAPDTPPDGGSTHTHAFSTVWKADKDEHFHVCSCNEKADVALHTYGEWTIVREASKESDGEEARTCTICGYKETRTVKYVAPEYTIRFYDENGTLLHTATVKEGERPSFIYTKTDTDEWKYIVLGWSDEKDGTVLSAIPTASGDASYYAAVRAEKKKYTLSFVTDGGIDVASVTREYGTEISAPEKPTKTGYAFVAWCTDAEGKNAVTWPLTLTKNMTLYAVWNEKVDIKAYLELLLSDVIPDPYAYIPESMRPGARTLPDGTITDYSDFVNKSLLPSRGYGEQWHMITDNLTQSEKFFSALKAVEGLTTTSVSTFQNYLDQNPGSTAHHTFASGIYNVTIDYDGKTMTYVLDYTTTFPVLGEQTAQIALSMDVATGEKTVRIQLGAPNALTYKASGHSYEFAIKYLGVRTACFRVEKKADGTVEGRINEYLTVAGKGLHSAADFYIGDDYVSAVGNKASGIPGFTGYINEVYETKTGKLLGYEVRETLSSVVYNTLWFDLSDVSGITSVKYREATGEESAAFFVNGSDAAFTTKNVGGIGGKMFSRRFDIELRTQYFYKYNAELGTYEEVAVKVPMLFVQVEQYDTLTKDIAAENKGINASIVISAGSLKKIKDDYATLIDAFIENNSDLTEDDIRRIIGDAVTFA